MRRFWLGLGCMMIGSALFGWMLYYMDFLYACLALIGYSMVIIGLYILDSDVIDEIYSKE